MNVNDLKVIIEMMSLCGNGFDAVKVYNGNVYATNGGTMTVRPVSNKEIKGFIPKDRLPMIKGVYDTNKKDKTFEYFLEDEIMTSYDNFPPHDVVENKLQEEFNFEINFDADLLVKALKSLKAKDNRIILKIQENNKPILFVHTNGKGLIAPIVR